MGRTTGVRKGLALISEQSDQGGHRRDVRERAEQVLGARGAGQFSKSLLQLIN